MQKPPKLYVYADLVKAIVYADSPSPAHLLPHRDEIDVTRENVMAIALPYIEDGYRLACMYGKDFCLVYENESRYTVQIVNKHEAGILPGFPRTKKDMFTTFSLTRKGLSLVLDLPEFVHIEYLERQQ